MKRWTSEEDDFLKKFYPIKGLTYCCDVLKRSKKSITHRKSLHGLRVSESLLSKIQKENAQKRDYMKYENFKVNPINFVKPNDPEISYILGLIWADGYVLNKGKGKANRVCLEVLKKDGDIFQNIFEKYGEWYITERRRNTEKIFKSIQTNNRPIVEFLIDNDYGSKSNLSPFKILKLIPYELHNYFFRGLSDGDGCFWVSKKHTQYQYSISSTHDQDWSYIEDLFKRLDIRYGISVKKFESGKSSSIRISNKGDICKFGNYIYSGFESDKIGLDRKYKKYLEITNS